MVNPSLKFLLEDQIFFSITNDVPSLMPIHVRPPFVALVGEPRFEWPGSSSGFRDLLRNIGQTQNFTYILLICDTLTDYSVSCQNCVIISEVRFCVPFGWEFTRAYDSHCSRATGSARAHTPLFECLPRESAPSSPCSSNSLTQLFWRVSKCMVPNDFGNLKWDNFLVRV